MMMKKQKTVVAEPDIKIAPQLWTARCYLTECVFGKRIFYIISRLWKL